jgi:hypothetical protein
MDYKPSATIWSTTNTGTYQIFNLNQLDTKIANILAQLYLSEENGMSQYFFCNHDFYQIADGKVLRIRIDVVDQSKLFKKKK